MKTKQGIFVDLLEGTPGRKPLDMQTPDTILVRMPYGRFRVRVVSPQPANVAITLDGKQLESKAIAPGAHYFDQGQDGVGFRFDPKDTPAPEAAPDSQPLEGNQPLTVDGVVGKPSSHGLVMVSVQLRERSATDETPACPAGPVENIFFQMNEPHNHYRAVAANLDRIIPPAGVTMSGCSLCQ